MRRVLRVLLPAALLCSSLPAGGAAGSARAGATVDGASAFSGRIPFA